MIKLPKPKHKYGYNQKEIKQICKKYNITEKIFNQNFGVNTCVVDKKGNFIFYSVDVERALALILGYRDVHPLEWD